VREWLQGAAGSRTAKQWGKDMMRAQWRWPVGMPLWAGRWELAFGNYAPICLRKRTARVLLCVYREPHGGAACVHQENTSNAG